MREAREEFAARAPRWLVRVMNERRQYAKATQADWERYDAPDVFTRVDVPDVQPQGLLSNEVAQVIDSVTNVSSTKDVDRHAIMLDLDVPAALLPSSTAGHNHLYIQPGHGKTVTWEQLERLLVALEDCGVIETGYLSVCRQRQATSVRLPWVRKRHEHEDSQNGGHLTTRMWAWLSSVLEDDDRDDNQGDPPW